MTDLLVVGDIGIDTYYLLDEHDACVNRPRNEQKATLCFEMGEKIPVEEIKQTVGGNAANVSIAATKLGLDTQIITYVGQDPDGRSALNTLEKNNVGIDEVKIGGQTNQTVALIYQTKRTLLVHHELRNYVFSTKHNTRWLYLTSTNIGGDKMNNDLAEYIASKNVKFVFSPGTMQRHAGPGGYKNLLKQTDLIVMNLREARDYVKDKKSDVDKLLIKLKELGPENAVITDETRGSYGIDNNNNLYHCPACRAKTVDDTGAGDAYSATLTVALSKGEALPEAMRWGSCNAASVVEHIGPQDGLLTLQKLKNKIEACPLWRQL
ncbi:MAG TPA: carbohydrate kinase family protein [bacterium]|nr:carbohydrate kinase family protein [bacterium]